MSVYLFIQMFVRPFVIYLCLGVFISIMCTSVPAFFRVLYFSMGVMLYGFARYVCMGLCIQLIRPFANPSVICLCRSLFLSRSLCGGVVRSSVVLFLFIDAFRDVCVSLVCYLCMCFVTSSFFRSLSLDVFISSVLPLCIYPVIVFCPSFVICLVTSYFVLFLQLFICQFVILFVLYLFYVQFVRSFVLSLFTLFVVYFFMYELMYFARSFCSLFIYSCMSVCIAFVRSFALSS